MKGLCHCFLLSSTTNKNKIEHSDTAIYLESDEPSKVIFHNGDILNHLPFHQLISVLLEVLLPRFHILWNRLSQRLQLIVTDDVKMRVGNERLLTDNIPCNLHIPHHLRPCFWTQEYPQSVPGRSEKLHTGRAWGFAVDAAVFEIVSGLLPRVDVCETSNRLTLRETRHLQYALSVTAGVLGESNARPVQPSFS
ncbi:hypothetical protein BJX65DRAFT_265234 [Aspergillus insuetus]